MVLEFFVTAVKAGGGKGECTSFWVDCGGLDTVVAPADLIELSSELFDPDLQEHGSKGVMVNGVGEYSAR
jgi:hypothetical protein